MRVFILIVVMISVFGCKKKGDDASKSKASGKTTSQAATKTPDKAQNGAPLAQSGVEDSARFDVYVSGKKLVTTTCKLAKDGAYSAQTTVSYAGQSIKKSTGITTDKSGHWTTMELTSPGGNKRVKRSGDTIEILNTNTKKRFSLKGKPGHILYDSNCMVFETFALRQYDHKKGGPQKIMRFIIPGKMEPFTFTAKKDETVQVAGNSKTFKRYDM
ncbi:hypothetical protein KJ865_11980, partial [Myxococcota bacterium]|nr:hypothetical protein [Myxococcota bacterium]